MIAPLAITCRVLAVFSLVAPLVSAAETSLSEPPIDRQALVERHNPSNRSLDILSPFTLGNGEFAVTVDATGLQTFNTRYADGIPLGTLSNWGWHSVDNQANYQLSDTFTPYAVDGRKVNYAAKQHSQAGQWLRANPHRLHLGRVGLSLGSKPLSIDDVSDIDQRLDMWRGRTTSQFALDGHKVSVVSAVNPQSDQLASVVKSPLLASGDLVVEFEYPYGSLSWGKDPADWQSPAKHKTQVIHRRDHVVVLKRHLDDTQYYVRITWQGEARWQQLGPHRYQLKAQKPELSFSVEYTPSAPRAEPQPAAKTLAAAEEHWSGFWQTGGAIDLSLSEDPRAHELERRIVLSRYLTAIQTSGSVPPAETGLTCNSWYGKFHLEMHWWHGVHYALWQKSALFEKSLGWYRDRLATAKAKAKHQGYAGARWPKMVGPGGRESPSTIGVFLVWQQPHPIYYAELLYQLSGRDPQVLQEHRERVMETASFMADFVRFNKKTGRYDLAAPLIPAQEIYTAEQTHNPTFELAYWRYGLELAQIWRQRLGLSVDKDWQKKLDLWAPLPMNKGRYVNAGNAPDTFADDAHLNDHPSVLGIFGMLPGRGVDRLAMDKTFDAIFNRWNWQRTWGWDYPLVAMSAARLGRPEQAVQALLMDVPKNRYLNNGHNYQEESLPIYLPGNGALLTAVAMMAAGWSGAPEKHAPGFPQEGWTVRYENISPLP